ncbi:MAG: thioredoxin domain-containing protein [Desulfuromonas sp.]|nr:MAG: thioredoxin domain-containing protein [Desulfuromonas sp.]
MNKLQNEKSPYLLQHADNPVDWYPWSDEALDRAKMENRPIFVSIGYSSCHWCHVMAHESFEDDEVAGHLNRTFISIKIDREERPDIDAGFMHACHLLNGHGGWPLNLFLTPDGKPFHALTYAPRNSAHGQPGFIAIVEKIAELWEQQPARLEDAAERLTQAVLGLESHQQEQEPDSQLLAEAAQSFRQQYDTIHAGFGRAPKFPQPHNVTLLLRLAQRQDDPELQQMALTTLERIAAGGISDQLGGGLHRYSVDARWLVPHFEKMLYDQALISDAYLEAWQISGRELFKTAAEETLDYVLRELQHPEGGFYCGVDADSEGSEGTYYLWHDDELRELLNDEEYSIFSSCYDVTPEGNFEGKNILQRTPAEPSEQQDKQLADIRSKLFTVRNKRIAPDTDDKVLTAWNGLMIASLARAGFLLKRSDYRVAARKAVDFIRQKLTSEKGLLRRYRDGEAAIAAFHEDYAYLIRGLIELFQAEFKPEDLRYALELNERCEALFSDDRGGYFDAADDYVSGMGRGRNKQDGAVPAAASVTAHNLLRLARLTGRRDYSAKARKLLRLHLAQAGNHPTAFAFLLQALDLSLQNELSLIMIAPENTIDDSWKKVVHSFSPSLVTVITDDTEELAALIPHCAGKTAIDGQLTAWACTGDSCLSPVTSADDLAQLLDVYAPLKTFIR